MRSKSLILLSLLVLAPGSWVTGQGAGASYRIGPGDLIEIRVFEEPQLNVERRVSAQGGIDLPLIGDFTASQLTEAQLATKLKEHLESLYLQRASVTVQVREIVSQPISVIGAVNHPGNLQRSGRLTLIEALTAVGGVTSTARYVYILRRGENGLSDQIRIDLENLLVRNDPHVNVPVFGGDVINVPASQSVTVYFLGEVGAQGSLEFSEAEHPTLLAAIARAGGLGERASSKLIIRRRGRDGAQREIEVNYKRILDGKEPDLELRDGDIIVVKESFF